MRRARSYEEILFSDDCKIIKGNYSKNEDKASKYLRTIEILEELQKNQGEDYIFAFRADDVNTPMYVHTIEIRWINDEATFEPPALLGEAIANMDSFHFDRSEPMNDTWLLHSEIYTEA